MAVKTLIPIDEVRIGGGSSFCQKKVQEHPAYSPEEEEHGNYDWSV